MTFVTLGDGRSTVVVEVEGDPGGPVSGAVELLGLVRRQVQGDLGGFKRAVEAARRDGPPDRVAA